MVWEKSDEKVICSSIAMLQERFRQLEKVKEMREERELLKLISSSVKKNNHHHHLQQPHHHHVTYNNSSNFYDDDDQPSAANSNFLFLSEISSSFPPLDSQLLSLSLWPSSSQTMKKNNNHAMMSYWMIQNTTQNLTAPSWLNDVPLARPSLIKKMDETATSEVDTTLHL